MNKNIKPLILVDSSYTSFYRFFATLRWFSFAYPEEYKKYKNDNSYNWQENKIFIEKYEKMYLTSIEKLIGKKIFSKSNIVFCMDSSKQDLWRTQLQKTYKGERIDLSIKNNFKPTFKYTYDIMIPNFIKTHNNIKSLQLDTIEADDIIAIITLSLKHIDQNIYIVSGDEDFLQLGRKNVTIINYKKKKPIILTEGQAKNALHRKILLGDVSDNIPSIFPKGKRIKKEEIIESSEKLKEYLDANPEAKKQYELNKLMIDFINIPKKYYNKVIELYNNLSF